MTMRFPNCEPSIVVGTRCRFDPSRYPDVQGIPGTKLLNLFGSARYQIAKDWQAYVTGIYSEQKTRFVIQPNPFSDQIFTTSTATGASDILLPPSSPFYPREAAIAAGVNGQPLNVRYRCVECGNRDTSDTNKQWQIIAGARGTAWNWDFDGSFNYGRNTSKEELNSGFPLFSGILPLLNSGRVNLFGPNTPEITQEVRATNFIGKTFDSKLDGYGVDVKGSGEIYTLPAGPIALAVGMHAGKEKLSQNPNPILQTGDISGYGGNLQPIDNSRTVWAVFGEVNIPIVKTLEGNVAVRYDRYDDFGSTTNPKVSLRWQPTRKLLLRGAWGTGFLAPTLFQLYNPQTPGLSQPGISDPLRCPVNDPNNADCQTQYTVTFGGNSSLKPRRLSRPHWAQSLSRWTEFRSRRLVRPRSRGHHHQRRSDRHHSGSRNLRPIQRIGDASGELRAHFRRPQSPLPDHGHRSALCQSRTREGPGNRYRCALLRTGDRPRPFRQLSSARITSSTTSSSPTAVSKV